MTFGLYNYKNVLRVVAIGFHAFMSMAKYCLGNICYLNTC